MTFSKNSKFEYVKVNFIKDNNHTILKHLKSKAYILTLFSILVEHCKLQMLA